MIGEAYRKFLWHRATIRRNTTSQSDTGVTKYNYAVILTDVPCNVQSNGGRMKVDDNGISAGKKLSVIFAREMAGQLRHNDLLIVNNAQFRIVNAHDSWYYGSHHVEIQVEDMSPQLGDVISEADQLGDAG